MVPEKDGDQLERQCEKLKSIAESQAEEEYSTYDKNKKGYFY
jgi:hypothetical protein